MLSISSFTEEDKPLKLAFLSAVLLQRDERTSDRRRRKEDHHPHNGTETKADNMLDILS